MPTFRGPMPPALLKANQPAPDYGDVRARKPAYDAASAAFGHFTMSVQEARRVLRPHLGAAREEAGPVERLLVKAEQELELWLTETVFLNPGKRSQRVLIDRDFDTSGAEEEGAQLVEVQRTANALVWTLPDPYLRLAVHCLARVHGCPSFSKDSPVSPDLPSARHTWILNPNPLARRKARRRTPSVSSSTISGLNAEAERHQIHLDTPPTTDLESRASGDELPLEETETELSAAEEEIPIAARNRVHRWASRLDTPREVQSEDDADETIVGPPPPREPGDESDGSDWAVDHEDAESLGLGESVASLSTYD